MRLSRLSISLAMMSVLVLASPDARAECNCVAIAGDVAAAIQAEVAKADGLYARGDYSGALAIYAKAYGTSKDAALLYAQGMAQWQLGATAEAKAKLEAYLKAGGALAYKDRAEASLKGIGAGVAAGAGAVAGVGTGLGKGALGVTGAVGASAVGTVEGGAGVVGGVATDVKPKKIGKKAGIVLGVIAIAAIGAVGIHSIAAGVSTDVELDPKFDLGLGVAGVAVGISAIYVSGLTAATAAAPPMCASLPAGKPIVAPIAMPGGGGLAAALSF
jgi:hypothetical protein